MMWFASYVPHSTLSPERKLALSHLQFAANVIVWGTIAILVIASCAQNPGTCILLAFLSGR